MSCEIRGKLGRVRKKSSVQDHSVCLLSLPTAVLFFIIYVCYIHVLLCIEYKEEEEEEEEKTFWKNRVLRGIVVYLFTFRASLGAN